MNQTVVSLLVGLVAGVGGALAVNAASSPAQADAALPVGTTADLGDLPQRLERIERLLRDRPLTAGPSLEGAAERGPLPSESATIEALVASLEERLKPTIQESVKSSVEEALGDVGREDLAAAPEKKKKRVTLAEVAAELELSAAEEEEVRRITAESTEAFLKLLADENQSVDDLRAEFQSAKDNPGKQAELGLKYMGKLMGNIGQVITVGMEHDTKMAKAIGRERADKLDEDYEVTDLDPLGLESIFDQD